MKVCTIGRLLVAALLAAAPAAAQDPARDAVENSTMKVGPFGLTPVLAIHDVGRDNNVFNESTNPKSDVTATISPKLDLLVHPGPLLLTVTTTSDYVYYQTYSSERGSNLGSTVRADVTFGRLRPFASIGGANTKERVNREIDTRARHRDRSYGGGLRVQILEGLYVSAGARRSTTIYDADATFRGESLADALNHTMEAADGSVGVALSPLTTVSVAFSKERDRFDLSPDRDSDTLRVMPTVTFSPLAMLSGSASFGYRRFTVRDPRAPDYRGFVSAVTLATSIGERTRLEGGFGRDVQYSYEEDAVYYVETGVQGTWTWEIAGPFDLRLSGSRARLHYPAPSLSDAVDEDISFTYGAGLAWRARPLLKIGLNADWRQRDSERSGDRGYENRTIYASVTWGNQ